MRTTAISSGILVSLLVFAKGVEAQTVTLGAGWQIQSSASVPEKGEQISTAAYRPAGWTSASVPTTVVGALVTTKQLPDPMSGMNLRSFPGTSYPIGRNFSGLAMPADSPYAVPWWFRTSFSVPAGMRGRRLSLRFDGITYRADIWLNGAKIASSDQVAGTYRMYEFDVTDRLISGANTLAVEVFPPQPDDLAWTWVDWNPMPPDKNMGLWRPVTLSASGDVTIRHPFVSSHVDSSAAAAMTVSADLRNLSAKPVRGMLRGRVESVTFEQRVELAAGETRAIEFTPEAFPDLRATRPRLWWPIDLGAPNLYDLTLEFVPADSTTVSDRASIRFGIREITSSLTPQGGRQFFVNGRPIVIRGGGWAPDMLLRSDPDRLAAELRYVRDMHLNTIRLEGKLEQEALFDLADEYGILVLAGWCCCDQWEQWAKWKPENRAIAAESQHDQICRLRRHPSVLAWLNGSDNPPPADIEQMYVDILKKLRWPNPFVSSATAKRTTVTGASGVKMTGPYDWVPPNYWLLDTTHGGAAGFNTETSPGAAIPPIESLKAMLPADHLWPIDDVWNFHAGGGQFKDVSSFTKAQNARYGESTSVEQYATTAQLMTYEGERAMFEAYARNAPQSTGVIQWMLNNAWPSMIWHLYDYFLRPGGGYFGAKKACEPLHVQYSYDDRSVVVVNMSSSPLEGATVTTRVLNLDMTETFADTRSISATGGTAARLLTIPEVANLSPTYFVDLRLRDKSGRELSNNFYWLSTTPDVLDFPKSTWYNTPVTRYADFTALRQVPTATVVASAAPPATADGWEKSRVTLTNRGTGLAFFIRLQVKRPDGSEVLPVLWEDNFISLLPGETRVIALQYLLKDRGPSRVGLVMSGLNVPAKPITP